jgi:hypothetical protein
VPPEAAESAAAAAEFGLSCEDDEAEAAEEGEIAMDNEWVGEEEADDEEAAVSFVVERVAREEGGCNDCDERGDLVSVGRGSVSPLRRDVLIVRPVEV